jgi:hypothetical protein
MVTLGYELSVHASDSAKRTVPAELSPGHV